jgi:hypothetical protein
MSQQVLNQVSIMVAGSRYSLSTGSVTIIYLNSVYYIAQHLGVGTDTVKSALDVDMGDISVVGIEEAVSSAYPDMPFEINF